MVDQWSMCTLPTTGDDLMNGGDLFDPDLGDQHVPPDVDQELPEPFGQPRSFGPPLGPPVLPVIEAPQDGPPEAENRDEEAPVDDGLNPEKPTAPQITALKRLHRAMGHPSPKVLAQTLELAGTAKHITDYVLKELNCQVCQARQRPIRQNRATAI